LPSDASKPGINGLRSRRNDAKTALSACKVSRAGGVRVGRARICAGAPWSFAIVIVNCVAFGSSATPGMIERMSALLIGWVRKLDSAAALKLRSGSPFGVAIAAVKLHTSGLAPGRIVLTSLAFKVFIENLLCRVRPGDL